MTRLYDISYDLGVHCELKPNLPLQTKYLQEKPITNLCTKFGADLFVTSNALKSNEGQANFTQVLQNKNNAASYLMCQNVILSI